MKNHSSQLTAGPPDDDERARSGVTASLVTEEAGSIRLILDDVVRDDEVRPRFWKHRCFYTSLHLELESLEEAELSERQMAAIGRALVVRLVAHRRATSSEKARP